MIVKQAVDHLDRPEGRPAFSGGRYQVLSSSDVTRLHNTALSLLSRVGMQVNNKQALDIFEDNGAIVDRATRLVKMPISMVEDAISTCPRQVVLAGRDPKDDLLLEGNRVYMGTGGTALYVLGLDGVKRPSTLKDVRQIARLVDGLDNIDFIVIPVYPNELDDKVQVDVNRFYASLSNTTKHIQGGVYTLQGIRHVIHMGELIAGGADELRRRPCVSFIVCLVSPLTMDDEFTDFIIEVAREGLPISLSVEPLSGATAPVTLAGHLAQWAAEVLGGLTLAQLVRKGAPCLPGYVGSITDLRTMDYLSGAVEQGLLNAGTAQLSHYWGLPCYSTSGMSDSKVLDAQAGYEGAATTMMAALAGANFIHDAAGLMEFAMVASYEKYVMDDEIIGMTKRAVRGIEVDEETIAEQLIARAGPAGNFLSEEHTVEHMRGEFYFPKLSNRERREDWEEAGCRDLRTVANSEARAILEEHQPVPIPAEIDRRIRAEIPLLV